jgi:5-formyltetrahydrofolate cyclo-ligase
MKDELRRRMRQRLRTLDENANRSVSLDGLELGLFPEPKTVFTFLSHGGEISTDELNEYYLARGAIVAAPKVTGDRMGFYRLTSAHGPFVQGAFGIREPAPDTELIFAPELRSPELSSPELSSPEPTTAPELNIAPEQSPTELRFPLLILIPGLAFDKNGDRLGKGAGYYDRFLTDFLRRFRARRAEITLAGACHDFQIVERVPTESHDIPVDCLLTERNAILCMEEQHG